MTNYRIDTYKNVNPYSNTWGNTKQEKVYDPVTCPVDYGGFKVEYDTTRAVYPTIQQVGFHYNTISNVSTASPSIIEINWGDGQIQTIRRDVATGGSGVYVYHQYSIAGTYTVTATFNDKISRISFVTENYLNYGVMMSKFYYFKATSQNFTGLSNLLLGQKNLEFDEDAFIETPYCYDYSSSFKCNQSISNIYDIPTTFLRNIGNNSTSTINLSNMFGDANFTTNNRFNINDMFSNFSFEKVYSIMALFGNMPYITGSGLDLINKITTEKPSISNYLWCFRNSTGLSDYASIPSDWK